MTKNRSFSIYLLKEGYTEKNSLKEEHKLKSDFKAEGLPDGAALFVLDNVPRDVWWAEYFGIGQKLKQVTKGALIFLPVGDRHFALSFGHVAHNLIDASYEYDFGLRVTLNSVDPKKLKSTDVLEPGDAKRQRTQLPVESDLTYFDFDRDSTILKSLTGKVSDEHKDLFRHATGASNLKISSDVTADQLADLCAKLLVLYASDKYKTTFPEIQNITPVRDPVVVSQLNEKLLIAFREEDERLDLTVPALINYNDNVYAAFSGAGSSKIYDDVFMGRYYEYLQDNKVDLNKLEISSFQKHSLLLTDEFGAPREGYTIHKCFVFDEVLDDGKATYHLCEGNWYKFEDSYIAKLKEYLDPRWSDISLPPYQHDSEGAYNLDVAAKDNSIICLDITNIAPAGQTAIEPCDLFAVENDTAVFYHVKVSTLSSMLSHLFNQGANSIELLKLEVDALKNLKKLLEKKAEKEQLATLVAPLDSAKHSVVFAIVTHKDKTKKSDNLPLFSRISLLRNLKALQLMSVSASYGFIEDQTKKTVGKTKPRKPRKKKEYDL